MLYSLRRFVVLCVGIAFTISLLICLTQSLKSWHEYLFENSRSDQLPKWETLTSNLRQMINYSSNDSQFFIFPDESHLVRAYLDVVRDTVCGLTLRTQEQAVHGSLSNIRPLNIDQRLKGLDWPLIGITMVGQKRLINIEWALRLVISKNIPGDFIECGVWRGGSSIFARAILKALNINDRHVWLADSFQGLPKARTSNDDDKWSKQEYLKVFIYIFWCKIFMS